MPSIRLTDRWLKAHRKSETRIEVADLIVPGLMIRVGREAVFFLRYRRGRKDAYRRVRIGPYPAVDLLEARRKARAMLERIDRGENPSVGDSVDALCGAYIEGHAKRFKRSWREDERMIRVYISPVLGGRKAGDVRRRDVISLVNGLVARAPIQANRLRALLSKIFKFGIVNEIVETSPVLGVPAPAPERRRERVLSLRELAALWRALDRRHAVVAGAFRFISLTGQRPSEVLLARWENIEDGWWTIPAGLVKNKMAHRVPVTPQAGEVLETMRGVDLSGGWIFPSPRRPGRPMIGTSLSHLARELSGELGFDFHPHDLRRTAASHMTSLGVARTVVGKILNHAETAKGYTTLPERSLLPTFWPVDVGQAELQLLTNTWRQPEVLDCAWAVEKYDYAKAHKIAAALRRQDSAGPILVAWTKPFELISSKQNALVFDLSGLIDQDLRPALRLWAREIAEDPSLWRNGFRIDRIGLIGHSFLERYGAQIPRCGSDLLAGEERIVRQGRPRRIPREAPVSP